MNDLKTLNVYNGKIDDMKKSFVRFENLFFQAIIFCVVFYAIYKVFPHFFPDYAKGAFFVKTESNRTLVSVIGLVFLWFALLKEQKQFSKNKSMSICTVIVLNYWYFLPGLFMNMLYLCEFEYVLSYTFFCCFFNMLIICFCRKKEPTTIKKQTISGSVKIDNDSLCLILAVVFLALNGFKIDITNIFNNADIYQTRFENRIFNSGYLYYLWYFIIFGSCIIPTWTVIALEKKQFIRVAFYTLCICSMYSVSCNRQFLFLQAFAFAFYFLRKKDNAVLFITLGMWLVTCMEFHFSETPLVSDILRRLSVVPNVNASFHVDFFTKNEPDVLRQALNFYLSRVNIISPYSKPIAAIVGKEYYGHVINANTGLIGGAFANYGYFSLVLGPMIYTGALKIFDKIFVNIKHKDVWFVTAVVIAFNFTNSETFLEQIIIPSWIFLYYLSMMFLPKDDLIGDIDSKRSGC